MKKLLFVFALFVLSATAFIGCKNPAGSVEKEETVETVKSSPQTESPKEEPKEEEPEVPPYVPAWVLVTTNEDAINTSTDKCAGIDFIVVNDNADNVLSDLISEGIIRLEVVEQKTLKADAEEWFGTAECIGNTISLYNVYVDTKKVTDTVNLTDISFSKYYNGEGTVHNRVVYYRYVIENINDEWKMSVYSGYSYNGGSLSNEIVTKKYIKKFYY